MAANININFISKRNIYYVVSGLLVAGSIFAVLTIGLKPSVEFSGGRTFGVKFAKTADNNMEFIKEKLSKKSLINEKYSNRYSYNIIFFCFFFVGVLNGQSRTQNCFCLEQVFQAVRINF